MRRLTGTVTLAILVAASLWWMQSRPAVPPAATHPAPATSTPASSRTSTPSGAPATGRPPAPDPPPLAEEADGAGTSERPSPGPHDPAASGSARNLPYIGAAVAFLTDFARPPVGTPESMWWARVRQHLSASAASAYAGTDPRQVPFTTVLAPATILPTGAPTHLLVQARVLTDAGPYLVEMETDDTGIRVTRAYPEPDR